MFRRSAAVRSLLHSLQPSPYSLSGQGALATSKRGLAVRSSTVRQSAFCPNCSVRGSFFKCTALAFVGYVATVVIDHHYQRASVDAEYSIENVIEDKPDLPTNPGSRSPSLLKSRSEESLMNVSWSGSSRTADEVDYDGAYLWSEVAPTLQPGDLVLMRGTGPLSHQITLGCHFYNWLSRRSLRYSHMAMVMDVIPPTPGASNSNLEQGEERPSKLEPERVSEYKVMFLEAVDNYDCRIPDFKGSTKFKAVQIVDGEKRIFGKDSDRWCYNRVAVRRMHGLDWTSERKQQLERFALENYSKDLDQDKKMCVAYASPSLYEFLSPASERTNKTTCTQLITRYFNSELKLLPDMTQNGGWPDVSYAPYWFSGGRVLSFLSTFQRSSHPSVGCSLNEALLCERRRRIEADPTNTKESIPAVFFGPEIRIAMPGATEYIDRAEHDVFLG